LFGPGIRSFAGCPHAVQKRNNIPANERGFKRDREEGYGWVKGIENPFTLQMVSNLLFHIESGSLRTNKGGQQRMSPQKFMEHDNLYLDIGFARL